MNNDSCLLFKESRPLLGTGNREERVTAGQRETEQSREGEKEGGESDRDKLNVLLWSIFFDMAVRQTAQRHDVQTLLRRCAPSPGRAALLGLDPEPPVRREPLNWAR
jgi:hypothetical protein